MPHNSTLRRFRGRAQYAALILATLLMFVAAPLSAQTIDDGIMVPRHGLIAGYSYTHDSWDEYWEVNARLPNNNIGALTT